MSSRKHISVFWETSGRIDEQTEDRRDNCYWDVCAHVAVFILGVLSVESVGDEGISLS
jgi:hypothetical protein